jgi:hypothetical protein
MRELEELRQAWAEQGRALAELRTVNARILEDVRAERIDGSLRRWRWLPAFELAAGLVAQVWLMQFIAGALGAPLLAGSGAALFLVALSTTVVAARQLVLLASIDYAGPVVEVQAQLERLRSLRIRATRWTLLLSPLLWTPLALVGARALLGIDLQRAVGWPWVLANLAVGYAFIPLGLWALARASRRWGQSAVWWRLRDDLAGRTLARALRSLEEVAAFQRDGA